MKTVRTASVAWRGGTKDGRGLITTQSGALRSHPYGFASRFEGMPGTSPEELLAAAHAGCITMGMTLMLGKFGLTAELIETEAKVTLDAVDGFTITRVDLTLNATVPGASKDQFAVIVERTKAECPVTKLLKAPVILNATLVDLISADVS